MADRLIAPLALDFLWEALDAGELPYPLEARSHGATMDERAALRRRVREDLVAGGLIDHAGRLDPQLEDWLGTLAQPDLSIDSVFLPDRDAAPVLALAAAARAGAVLAVQQPDGLRLRSIPRDGLVSAIVGMLPGASRGSEQSISVPAEELHQTVPAGAPNRTSTAETRKALATLTAMPNRRGGQIGVNSRSDMRGRRRSPVLAWFDNETGRYLTQTRGSSDGRDWVTIAPADAATLRHRIGELVTEVTSDRR
ncbi:ESX secretion-associated protein EspG [Actinophytocola sp.]|uniref:ESX secretion-associated protein EspG n=1 Tax=Actinophytocola sp. TaxID=1872138 RepID=UPI003D6B7A84